MDAADLEVARKALASMKAKAKETHRLTGEVDEPAQRMIRKYTRLIREAEAANRRGESE